ncbi:MAG TPA: PspA/IM30 family protein [Bryobacteraceae bacterium]|jgi:phage shock protein A|nr:PspA/IM30 family protein [Bryobacteraceae bacterium]
MGFFSDMFNRTGRVARGQVNKTVGAMEDATFEATVRQTIADMKTELNNVVRSSAMAMSNYNRLDAEYQKYVRQSQEWKDRANMALDAGNEDLAKKALAKKAESDRQIASLQAAVDSAKQASESLKAQVTELKHKIEEGERTATTLVARKNAAMAQRKVSEALAGVGKADNAFAVLSNFEQSVAKEEATAKAFDQLASSGTDATLESQFAQLEGHSVDAELEALKRERLGRVELPKELPAAGQQ